MRRNGVRDGPESALGLPNLAASQVVPVIQPTTTASKPQATASDTDTAGVLKPEIEIQMEQTTAVVKSRRNQVESISDAMTAALKELGYASITVYGTEKPVPQFLGDDVGVRPVLVCQSTSWIDTLAGTIDRYSPTFSQSRLVRLWLNNKFDAKRLLRELPALLTEKGGALRVTWFNIRKSNGDMELLQMEIAEIAEKLGLETMTDSEVLEILRAHAVRSATH